MARVEINGAIVEFPDTLSPEQLNAAVAAAAQQMGGAAPQRSRFGQMAMGAAEQIAQTNIGPMGVAQAAARYGSRDPRGTALHVAGALPMLGAMGLPAAATAMTGGMAAPAMMALGPFGAMAGEAAQQGVRRALGANPTPPKTIPFTNKPLSVPGLSPSLSNIAVEGITNAVPDVAAEAFRAAQPRMFKNAAGAARRALGWSKRHLNSPEKLRQVESSAETLLEEGMVPMIRSGRKVYDNLDEASRDVGQKIGDYLSGRGKGFDPKEAIIAINRLRPPYRGGEYESIHGIIDRATETIQAHGNKPISFQEANQLKSFLQDLAYELRSDKGGVRKSIAAAYRDALDNALSRPVYEMESIVENAAPAVGQVPQIGMAGRGAPQIGTTAMVPPPQPLGTPRGNLPPAINAPVRPKFVDPEVIPPEPPPFVPPPQPAPGVTINMQRTDPGEAAMAEFLRNKKVYGALEQGKEGIMNRISSELGNKQLGLRDAILLSQGGLPGMTMAVANHFLDRHGAGLAANVLYGLSQSPIPEVRMALQAALANALNRRPTNGQ